MLSRGVQLLSREASFESFEEAGRSDFNFQNTYISRNPTSHAWGGANELHDGGLLKCFNNSTCTVTLGQKFLQIAQ